MDYIQSKLSEDIAKKIFGNKEHATNYLIEMNKIEPIRSIKTREITRGKKLGKIILRILQKRFGI